MPTPATMQNRGPNNPDSQGSPRSQRVTMVPFIRASAEHREPSGIDVSRLQTTSAQDLGVFEIPAYGYLRSLVLLVTATGGVGASTATADAPWSVLSNIFLTEPNGSVLSQFNSGYDLKECMKWGGQRWPWAADPAGSPAYVDSDFAANGNYQFLLRVPVELNLRDALGSLPNQNAAATFKLRLTLAASTDVYTVAPSPLPTVRVQVFSEEWDQPEVSSAGVTNQIVPPAMNTTQFWSPQIFNISAGQQTIRLTRVGNYIRNLIFIFRSGSPATRANGNTDWPNPLTLYLDTRPLDIIERQNWFNQEYERTGFGGTIGHRIATAGLSIANDTSRSLDNGVFVYDFMHEFDGGLGRENRDLWLPTLGSTRLEIQGNFSPVSGNSGVLTVYTNDVAIAGSVFI
jgi:hypothetical protein